MKQNKDECQCWFHQNPLYKATFASFAMEGNYFKCTTCGKFMVAPKEK